MKPIVIIAALFFTAMVKAQIINIPDPNFKAALIAQGYDLNTDGEIQESEAFPITSISLNAYPLITSIVGIQGFVNLSGLNIMNLPQLTSIDVSNMAHLSGISFQQLSSVTTINVTGCSLLTSVTLISVPNVASLDFSGITTLSTLFINGNAYIGPHMYLTSLNLNGCTGLKNFSIAQSSLAALDLSSCGLLETFNYEDNLVPNLDVSNHTALQTLYASSNTQSNTLLSLNANGCTALNSVYVSYNTALQYLYIKNGRNETLSLFDSLDLVFICADDSQVPSIQSQLNSAGLTSTVCNSYCSFTPGGTYNTISGTITLDADNNGCDAGDPIRPNIKVDLGSPVSGSTFTNNSGTYIFYANAGSFQWAPGLENPTWFNISPTQGTTTFADSNSNIATQNFCLSANGAHPDLEVVISPITAARPGFDASYKITYKNKGNQTLSGNLTFTFDDSILDFVSAFPSVDVLGTNSLSWTYTNLLPFESRVITLRLHVSPPPTVNIGDVLNFTTAITPVAGDELPSDNSFAYHQTVVGSYDPNSIECLEGALVPTSEIGNYLHYAINFENTGNYQAENVVVKDIIDTAKYDINSLQLLSTSHPCYTRITGNVVEFIFQGIDLAAVSGNPPVGGHGDVLFKIRSKNNLVSGDQVSKTGKIYFDYNAPIDTNIAQTTFQNLNTGIHPDNSISIYPNPANSIINIRCDSAIKTIELFDIQGRLLEADLTNSNDTVFDIGAKQKGIYFLRIKTEKGSKTEKIVKE